MFEEFLAVSDRLKKSALVSSPARYSEVKELAKDYQAAKNQVPIPKPKSFWSSLQGFVFLNVAISTRVVVHSTLNVGCFID